MARLIEARGLSKVYGARGGVQVRAVDEVSLTVEDGEFVGITGPSGSGKSTLPHHGGLIVEYAGMPDVPDYMEGIRHKERVYAANWLPALFLYPADLRGPWWPERVIRQTGSVARCAGASESLQYVSSRTADS